MKPTFSHNISNPDNLYDPTGYGYSHVASVAPNTTMIYVAGQGGGKHDIDTIPNFQSQVQQAFVNLKTALASQGCTMQNIAKLTTLIVDHSEAKHHVLIEESKKYWADHQLPTQSLIPVPRLAVDGMLFEVEAVAAKAKAD